MSSYSTANDCFICVAVAIAASATGIRTEGREALHEVIDPRGNVFAVLAEGRHDEMNDVDAIKKIFAEQSLSEQLSEIPVRGRYDPHVRCERHALRERRR